jgi:glyoxylase-like metal-dependent hydrolase (beta-lactamase superfamily II)
VRVGDIELTPLSDGEARLTPGWYVGFDEERHAWMLDDDGRVHIPIGCYLVRTGDRTLLLDAGLGPNAFDWADGGRLPDALARAGASAADIDTVVCTHLHLDHAGWLVRDEEPYFPRATVWYGAGDWTYFVDEADELHRSIADAMLLLRDRDRVRPIDADMTPIAPGVTARLTPGHTPGSCSLVVSSGDERVVLLGDAIECPLQIEEPEFHIISDVDPDLARRTRELLWQELEGTDTLVGAAHFPELQFGRVLAGEGRRYFSSA